MIYIDGKISPSVTLWVNKAPTADKIIMVGFVKKRNPRDWFLRHTVEINHSIEPDSWFKENCHGAYEYTVRSHSAVATFSRQSEAMAFKLAFL